MYCHFFFGNVWSLEILGDILSLLGDTGLLNDQERVQKEMDTAFLQTYVQSAYTIIYIHPHPHIIVLTACDSNVFFLSTQPSESQ